MKQILAMLRLDVQLILRDKVIWYVLLFPAIMAMILILVSGKIGDETPTFVLDEQVPQTIVVNLEQVATIEQVQRRQELHERVKAFDHVAGIVWENEAIKVIYQGNEGDDYVKKTAGIIDGAINKQLPEMRVVNTSTSKDAIVLIVMAALLMAPTLIGGTVSGFLIVGDKEYQLMRGYQIAPIRFSHYIGARSILASVIGLISMTILCVIFMLSEQIGLLTAVLASSLPLFGVITLLFGSIAKEQVSSIAVFKILVLVFLVLPLASAFVPDKLHVIFYPVPMYWQFQSIRHILNHQYEWHYGMVTFLSSLVLLILVSAIFRNKMQKI